MKTVEMTKKEKEAWNGLFKIIRAYLVLERNRNESFITHLF